MSYAEFDNLIIQLEQIMAKTSLAKSDVVFITTFISKLVEFSNYIYDINKFKPNHLRFYEKHFNYLLNLPFLSKQERDLVRFVFDKYLTYNLSIVDFSLIDVANINFSNGIIPHELMINYPKRKEVLDYLRKNNIAFTIYHSDFRDANELSGLNAFISTPTLGILSLNEFLHISDILKKATGQYYVNFASRDILRILKDYYDKTKDPEISVNTKLMIGSSININELKNGGILLFNYERNSLNTAIEYAKWVAKNDRTDMKINICFPDFNTYSKMPYSLRKENDERIRQLKKYGNVTIEFEKNIEEGRYSVNEYLQCLNYYDKIAKKIKKMNLSPFEQYLCAFNIAKTYKHYNYFKNVDTDFKYPNISRNPFLILKNDSMVCTGYVLFLREILDRLGIRNGVLDENMQKNDNAIGLNWHSRLLVGIIDDKYKMDQVLVSDPTWSSLSKFEIEGYNKPILSRIAFYVNSAKKKMSEIPYATASVTTRKKNSDELEQEYQEKLHAALEQMGRRPDNEDLTFNPEHIKEVELNKLFWAIRNLKKKECKKIIRQELDNYQSRVMRHFLYTESGVRHFKHYLETNELEGFLDFFNMFGLNDKLFIVNRIMEIYHDNRLFQVYQIKELYLTNLSLLTWDNIKYLPADFRIEIIKKIFALKQIDAKDIYIIDDKTITFIVFGKMYQKPINSRENIADFAEKLSKARFFLEAREKILASAEDFLSLSAKK